MQKRLLCDIPIKSYTILNITMYDIIQNNFTQTWALKDYNLCVGPTSMDEPIKKQMINKYLFP